MGVSKESIQDSGAATYLPYYVRLCGEIVLLRAAHFKASDLGTRPHEMQERFLRYVREDDPNVLWGLQALASALHFDEDLFDRLVHHHLIVGIPIDAFKSKLIAARSYVEFLESGQFRFHRRMQMVLLDSIDADPEPPNASRNFSRFCWNACWKSQGSKTGSSIRKSTSAPTAMP